MIFHKKKKKKDDVKPGGKNKKTITTMPISIWGDHKENRFK